MKELDRLEKEYERERIVVMLDHMLQRRICFRRGMEKTIRHNEMKRRKTRGREQRMKTKVKKSVVTERKKLNTGGNVTSVTWKPTTTKEDIEKKLKSKGITLKSRIRPTTKMVTSRKGRPPKEVVFF